MAFGDYLTITNIGGAIAVVFVFIALWLLFRKQSGRLGEEKLEEKETDDLKKDEMVVEVTQRDEKKQCRRIRKVMEELRTLASNLDSSFARNKEAYNSHNLTNLSLDRLESEKMNLKVATETFRMLHNSISFFISQLPKNLTQTNILVEELNELQKKYYSDLIKEVEMHREDKTKLMRLLQQEIDQEKGDGQLAA